MKKNIKDYDFVDCLLIDFGVDKLISTLYIIVEAYYPFSSEGLRKKGLLKILFNQVFKSVIEKNEEFERDIAIDYDKNGNDTKANEIYIIEILRIGDSYQKAIVDADMLKMEVECNEIFIIEI